ncbi:MAG: acylglycerol kinase family protein, partial [Gallicola sp.]|nr:acylglycerol kinase family protein [Gallicola sp.]
MLSKVLIIVNPVAGKGKAKEYGEKLASVIKDHYQAKISLKSTEKEGDAIAWSREAANSGYDGVICLGGDGTVSETLEGLSQANGKPLFGLIPMGTVNDLARALGYSLDAEEVITSYANIYPGKLDIAR